MECATCGKAWTAAERHERQWGWCWSCARAYCEPCVARLERRRTLPFGLQGIPRCAACGRDVELISTDRYFPVP